MTRRRLTIVLLPVALTAVLLAALGWLQYTESGARWIWSHASAFVPATLRAEDIHGDLHSGLSLQGVTFENQTTTVSAGSVRLQLGFKIFSPAVVVESLLADRISIKRLAPSDSAPAKSLSDILASLSLPLSLNFAGVRIGQLVYQDENGATMLESGTLSFAGQWFDGWIIRDLIVHTHAAEWRVQGRIGFQAPFPVDASVSGSIELPASGNSAPVLRLLAKFTGTVSDMGVEAKLEQPAVTLRGHIRDLPHDPDWELDLLAGMLQWPLEGTAPQVTLQQVSARASGDLQRYRFQIAGEVGVRELPAMTADLHGTGDARGIRIENLQLSGDSVGLSAHGALSWADGFSIELVSAIEQLDPGLWLSAWPQDQALSGSLAVDWQADHVLLRNLDLKAIHNDFSVRGKGELDLAADIVDADLEWSALRWPPASDQADFSSAQGHVQLHGKPDDWLLSGSMQLQASRWPEGLLELSGKGNRESMQMSIERGEVLGGVFDGQFDYRWTGEQPWTARINAHKLDITALSSTFPGALSGTFSAQGSIKPLAFDIDTEQMEGIIRGRAVTARGGVSISAGGMRARNLRIQSGPSNLELDGDMQSAEGIRFAAHIESLADLIEGAGGNIEGEGRFSANPQHPQLELELRGSALSWKDWHLDTLATRRLQDPAFGATTRFELTNLSYRDQLVEAIELTLGGQNPLEDIRLEAQRGETSLEAQLSGSITGRSALSKARWNGKIESLRIHNQTLGSLELEQAAGLMIGFTAVDIQSACVKGSRNGRVCFDGNWTGGHDLTAHASLEAISLNLAQLILGTNLDYSQTLTGKIEWRKPPGEKLSAQARVELSPGQITFGQDETPLNTGSGLLEFSIIDGRLLSGNLDLALPGAGSIDADFRVLDISRGTKSDIDGRVQIAFDHIEPLLQWIPALLDRFAGSVNADVRLSGTLADPRLTGHASLVRGRFEHSASGTVITDIQLAGAVYEFDYTELYGSFKAGEGRGSIKAAVKFDKFFDPDITLDLSGQNLTLVAVPEMSLKADPDLHLHWHENLLNLNGRLLIPSARISPRYLPISTASESPDLVISGGEQTEPEETYFDRSKLRLDGSVVVELGKDVTVKLEKATARLRGNVTFEWNKNLLPIANGTYTLSGEISAYGQLLEVAEGRISFPHVPADNPHLNINAEREIYGNVQIKQAGVHVTGTLKQPLFEPYTIPVTTRERALTLLVTGHDFDYEQGVGGVEVGMYIAPRLYVSYGIGLFEAQSVISARYDLKNGFGIKATSGQRETGVDISYTIER